MNKEQKKKNDRKSNVDVLVGMNSLNQLPELIKKYGNKPLLVHGHRPVEDGLLEKVRVILTQAGIPYGNLGQILPNPKFSSVKRGVKEARREHCDFILALGGGSTLQCAKGIAYGMEYKGKKLWNLWKGREKPKGAMPFGSILTNPATGSELDDNCTLVKDGKRRTLSSPYGTCRFAILDPSLSILPQYPTMNQAAEIFVYTFVRYLDSEDEQVQGEAIQVLKDLLACARALSGDITDIAARTQLFESGLNAHKLHQKGDNDLTRVASKLAFKHSLPTGTAVTALFPSWYELQIKDNEAKLSRLAGELFKDENSTETADSRQGLEQLVKWLGNIRMPANIPQTGLVLMEEELEEIAENKRQLKMLTMANKDRKDF